MPNITPTSGPQKSAAASQEPLPLTLKRALADALVLDHPDAPWRPPEQLPPAVDLRRGVAVLEGQLRPVDKKHAAYCLSKLDAAFNLHLDDDAVEMKLGIWLEACAGVPNDLWSAGILDLIRSWKRDDHYGRTPEPADFLGVVKDRIERRQRDLQRTQAMLRQATQGSAKPFVADPRHVVLLTLLKWQERPGSIAFNVLNAAKTRRDLAALAEVERMAASTEDRPVAPWAAEDYLAGIAVAATAVAPVTSPPPAQQQRSPEREAMIRATRAAAAELTRVGFPIDPWQAGEPVYQHDEEPPPPDAILEAEHGDATA